MCLSDCINCLYLPPLGQLPSLEELSIVRINLVKRVGPEFYRNGSSSEPFQKLKTLSFVGMPKWEEWQSFGGEGGAFPSLEVLHIQNCPRLRGDLPNHLHFLKELVISECRQLKVSIPRDASLSVLDLNGCREVVYPCIGVKGRSLQYLHIGQFHNTTRLAYGPIVQFSLTSLTELNMVGCTSLLSFPETGLPSMLEYLRIQRCDALKSLPEGMFYGCTRFLELRIIQCPSLKSFPRRSVPTTLKLLVIEKCKKLELVLPEAEETMHNYHASLVVLGIISSYDPLKSFPLGLFPKLHFLVLSDCINLESLWIPDAAPREDLTSLGSLQIISCPKFVSFPEGGLPTPNLKELYMHYCGNLKSLPQRMHTTLPSLHRLDVMDCPELESFPEGGLPSNLTKLGIYNCNKLMAHRMEWGLQALGSLKTIKIKGCEEVELFPEEWLLPSTLTGLQIQDCPNLKYLDKRGLQHITSLEQLYINECPKLECLPKEGLPPSLSFLSIWRSPLLEKRCRRKRGKDWPKIARIPCVLIGEEFI